MAKRKILIVENLVRGRYAVLKHLVKVAKKVESQTKFDPMNKDERKEMKEVLNLLREAFVVVRAFHDLIELEKDKAAKGEGDPDEAFVVTDTDQHLYDEAERLLIELDEDTAH